MKKKGILLLGSLTLMVIAMVFIAVTLVSRASVTPETSDAATLKKKDVVSATRLAGDVKYSYLQFEHHGGSSSYVSGINDDGVVVGIEVSDRDGYIGVAWDNEGKYITDLDSRVYKSSPLGINKNLIIGNRWDIGVRQYGYVYDLKSKQYKELKDLVGNDLPSKMLVEEIKDQVFSKESSVKSGKISVNSRDRSMIMGSKGTSFSYSVPIQINAQGDIIGISNGKAALWSKIDWERGAVVDIDKIVMAKLTDKDFHTWGTTISNEINGVVKIAGDIDYFNKDQIDNYVIEYSVTNNKVEKVTIIDNSRMVNEGKSGRVRSITDDGTLTIQQYTDVYVLTSKDTYSTRYGIKEILSKNGIIMNPDGYGEFEGYMNNRKDMWGVFYWDKRPYPYGDIYITNLNTNEAFVARLLAENNQIKGFPDKWQIYGFTIPNEKGVQAVNLYTDSGDYFTGKLTPIK